MKDEQTQHPFAKLAQPAQRALAGAGIANLKQLAQLTEKEFLALHGIGKNAHGVLKGALADNGLDFRLAEH